MTNKRQQNATPTHNVNTQHTEPLTYIYGKSTANIMLNRQRPKASPLELATVQHCAGDSAQDN